MNQFFLWAISFYSCTINLALLRVIYCFSFITSINFTWIKKCMYYEDINFDNEFASVYLKKIKKFIYLLMNKLTHLLN